MDGRGQSLVRRVHRRPGIADVSRTGESTATFHECRRPVPGSEIVFDTVPCWFSDLTRLGLNQTIRYRLLPMPWGINRDEIRPTLHQWHPRVASVAFLDHQTPRGLSRLLADMTNHIPFARHCIPSLVHVTIADTNDQSAMLASAVARETSLDGLEEDGSHLSIRPAFRKPKMTSESDDVAHADMMGGVLTAVRQNARHGGDIAGATSQVIAKRVTLGIAAAFNPVLADDAEFARIIPEKVEAFSTAGMAMLKQSGQANRQIMRLASDEVMTTARATIEITGCPGPAALAEAAKQVCSRVVQPGGL